MFIVYNVPDPKLGIVSLTVNKISTILAFQESEFIPPFILYFTRIY